MIILGGIFMIVVALSIYAALHRELNEMKAEVRRLGDLLESERASP